MILQLTSSGKTLTVYVPDEKLEHGATFPEKLIRPFILSSSKENDLVLDPFIGSGTTAGPGKSGHIHVHVGDTNHNDGGEILLEAGSTSGNKNGGLFKIQAGSSTGTTNGIGGQLNVYSGHAKKNTGGSLSIIAGYSTDTTSVITGDFGDASK